MEQTLEKMVTEVGWSGVLSILEKIATRQSMRQATLIETKDFTSLAGAIEAVACLAMEKDL